MNIIIVSNYFEPEIGAAPNRIFNLSKGLVDRSNEVSVVCPLPNYPTGTIFKNYRHNLFCKEQMDGIKTYRYWIYPSASKNPIKRVISMFSFALSLWCFSFNFKLIRKSDWIIIQNSPLLVSMSAIILLKKMFRKRIALNISDLWPISALELGYIKRNWFYTLLEWIENFNYRNANLIIGQSEEILEHVSQCVNKPTFLYRNLQINNNTIMTGSEISEDGKIRLIYAGLLGIAQGIFNIISSINFDAINASLHIYGHGNEEKRIKNFIRDNPNHGITYKGSVNKEKIQHIIPGYHASLVPLKNCIRGAVPSKIFELIYLQVPILFCGGGEGAKIVDKYKTGFCSDPGDFKALEENILRFSRMGYKEYFKIKQNCKEANNSVFDFNKQLDKLIAVLKNEK